MPPEVHSVLGASAADRWMNCTPSAQLTAGMEDETTTFAAEGTAAHALCEWKVRKALKMRAGRRPTSDYWTDEMEEFTDDYRDFIMDLVGQAKLTYKDPVTLIEQHLDFPCYVPDGFGTDDFLLVADKELNVVDFKYGRGVAVYADHNPQMMLYALGALNLFDCLYDIEQVTMTIFQSRLSSISTWTISAEELYKWAEEVLKPKAELAAKGEGEFISGSWCRFCKARNTCRARAESFLELAKMEFQPPALLSDEEVAEVMEKADELSKWASDVMAYAQAEAIENGKHWNGYKLVEGRSTRRFTDEKKVEEAAKGAGYTDIYNKSLITLTAFEKLMGKDTFNEVLGSYVTKPAGKLTLVPVSDKRPEVTVNTVNDEFQED
ncbi:DUF2800 domain-containing protein [Clostridium sp. OF09-36]|uniref:DUF2800 domain-containing protein n=1 Tax=Clostridium sp. OF09-36 TaxID=2292310 RepID=UPI000E48A23E|nr:DUF2800 domain-containing protein [Clostridium sp. OF09-36]RHV85826.1 DUF2800 domain-containing protein [Clostridium sp. OF09-36]